MEGVVDLNLFANEQAERRVSATGNHTPLLALKLEDQCTYFTVANAISRTRRFLKTMLASKVNLLRYIYCWPLATNVPHNSVALLERATFVFGVKVRSPTECAKELKFALK